MSCSPVIFHNPCGRDFTSDTVNKFLASVAIYCDLVGKAAFSK